MNDLNNVLNPLRMLRPDKILAAAVVEYLPEKTLLDSNCQETLKIIVNIAHIQLRRMGRISDIPFCHPSRGYLAEKIGKSESTIKRGSAKLEEMGLIQRQQTRRRSGRYTINRYWFGSRLLEILAAFFRKFAPWVRTMTHGNLNRGLYKSNRKALGKIPLYQEESSPYCDNKIGQEWKKKLEKWREESIQQTNNPIMLVSLTEMFTKTRQEMH